MEYDVDFFEKMFLVLKNVDDDSVKWCGTGFESFWCVQTNAYGEKWKVHYRWSKTLEAFHAVEQVLVHQA
jgi:hypothetical protein